ncbi:MAG: LysM peptidoglycan-binding domain-containing protein [Ardenticatenaceae bacterium]|nr:LysM peptidoglycan-binding domain-containing protein [Ardenticatenaceae bacterium]
MSVRRMLPFILINILVSATVVLVMLTWWERRQEENVADAAATVLQLTPPAGTGTNAPLATTNPGSASQPTAETQTNNNGQTLYQVKAGDTLGGIAQQFDVAIEDIVAANNLDNPNLLDVGQELIIPEAGFAAGEGEGEPAATTAPTPAPAGATASPAPIPTEEPLDQGVIIVEITEVIGVGDLATEAVSIANFGDRAVALQGWELADSAGHIYTFGQVTLFGEGAAILIHTETGRDGPSDLYWGLEEAIWQSGATVTLRDATGTVQATFNIP